MNYKLSKENMANKSLEIKRLKRESIAENIPTILCGLGSICLYGLGASLGNDITVLNGIIVGSSAVLAACTGVSALAVNTTSIAKNRRNKIKLLKLEKEYEISTNTSKTR